MGVLSLLLLLCFYIFPDHPAQHRASSHPSAESEQGGEKRNTRLTPRRARVENFLKMFFSAKKCIRHSFHPRPLPPASLSFEKKNIKSPLKYNSPLFHITSNIDKHTHTHNNLIQQNTHTSVVGENRWEILIIIPYITVLFLVRRVSNTTLLEQEETGIMRVERGRASTHHQFKAITLVFLTHTLPPIIISHHHRWKTEKKSQDARMPGGDSGMGLAGVLRMRVFSFPVRAKRVMPLVWGSALYEKVGCKKKNLWSAPFMLRGPVSLSRHLSAKKKNIINYNTFFF